MSDGKLSITPITITMDDSLSSGSLNGSVGDLIIPMISSNDDSFIGESLDDLAGLSSIPKKLTPNQNHGIDTKSLNIPGAARNSSISAKSSSNLMVRSSSNLSANSTSNLNVKSNSNLFSRSNSNLSANSNSYLMLNSNSNLTGKSGSNLSAKSNSFLMLNSNINLSAKSGSNLSAKSSGNLSAKSNSNLMDKSNSNLTTDYKPRPKVVTRSNSKDKFSLSKSFQGASTKVLKDFNESNSLSNSKSASRLHSMERLSKARFGKITTELGHIQMSASIGSQDSEFEYCLSDSNSTDLTTEESSMIGESTLDLYNNLFTFSNDDAQEVKKAKRRKHRGKLMLKLTNSEMDLLGDRTGVFNGVNDKYRRFLSGDAKLKKISEPVTWEYIVGLPPTSSKRGKMELDNRLATRADLKKKTQILEELRILYLL